MPTLPRTLSTSRHMETGIFSAFPKTHGMQAAQVPFSPDKQNSRIKQIQRIPFPTKVRMQRLSRLKYPAHNDLHRSSSRSPFASPISKPFFTIILRNSTFVFRDHPGRQRLDSPTQQRTAEILNPFAKSKPLTPQSPAKTAEQTGINKKKPRRSIRTQRCPQTLCWVFRLIDFQSGKRGRGTGID